MQLEKGLIRESEGTQTNSTLTAILETKDARISTLEKALALMEEELNRAREASNTSPMLDLTFATSQLSLKNQMKETLATAAAEELSEVQKPTRNH
ncbi:unnamed protein product [Nezara viridula]|uniref:Uncharacterized protein n=1 Tax=Nezara viridula TaxID=85310 RepID=A0A9P0E7Y3_NEZVI|nr:unnamed protein product [Nezara viridula]